MEEKSFTEGTPRKKRMTGEELDLERRKSGIEMSRARVLQDLQNCSNPRYRTYLEGALQALDAQLAAVEKGGH